MGLVWVWVEEWRKMGGIEGGEWVFWSEEEDGRRPTWRGSWIGWSASGSGVGSRVVGSAEITHVESRHPALLRGGEKVQGVVMPSLEWGRSWSKDGNLMETRWIRIEPHTIRFQHERE
jgi:hypothetical protein